MNPTEKARFLESLGRLVHAIADAMGSNCEVVLHDLGCPENSIIAIANGQVTGRKVGDSLDVFGLQVLRQVPTEDLINYRTETRDGKALRSSSIFLRDENGEIFGALCINLNITGFLVAQEFLSEITAPDKTGIKEQFEHSIDDVLKILLKEAVRSTGKEVSAMERADKIAVIAFLESKGTFMIRYSIDHVAAFLNLSKFTIYNYLDEIRSKSKQVAVLE